MFTICLPTSKNFKGQCYSSTKTVNKTTLQLTKDCMKSVWNLKPEFVAVGVVHHPKAAWVRALLWAGKVQSSEAAGKENAEEEDGEEEKVSAEKGDDEEEKESAETLAQGSIENKFTHCSAVEVMLGYRVPAAPPDAEKQCSMPPIVFSEAQLIRV